MLSQSLLVRVPFLLLMALLISIIPDGTIVFWLGCACIGVLLLHSVLTLDGFLRLDIGFYGSSGIIGHACRWQVPVIACKAGLIGRIVLRNRLGWTVDPSNVGQFASVIRSVCRGHTEFSEDNANDYARLASSQAFVSALLSS
jgi:hypothetical protein